MAEIAVICDAVGHVAGAPKDDNEYNYEYCYCSSSLVTFGYI